MVLLIHPPIAKPSEPPAGIAKLAGALNMHGIKHRVLDANIEAQLWLAENTGVVSTDTWDLVATRNVKETISALRDPDTYTNFDRYGRNVRDLNHVLQISTESKIGLAVYEDKSLSPLKSRDLLHIAEEPQESPFYRYFSARLREVMEEDAPRYVGFSVNYLTQALSAFAMAGFIKKLSPSTRIIMGGGLITSWLSQPGFDKDIFSGLVDHLVIGPGEYKLLEIIGQSGVDIKKHISPDYSGFPVQDYLSPGFILPYSASSGCWWGKCSFCPETAEGGAYKKVATGDVLTDIKKASVNASLIHLLDNSVSPALVRGLMEEPPGVPWYGFARIAPELCDDDYCDMLKKSGCVMLKLGLESGDQGVLDAMQKGIEIKTAGLALKALKRAGIATYVYLLFGTPPESYEGARRTLEFTSEHAEAIGFLNVAVFNMPAYGDEATRHDTRSFSEGDLSLYSDFTHPLGWSRGKVRRFITSEFKKNKNIAGILRRTPPLFTSNHAAYFV
ncbi:B12-binding domain-containing radical SAM protein [Nitrospirota bacterium]